MKNLLLTLAATSALLIGGLTFADTAEARPRGWSRGWGGYNGRYYRPNFGYRSTYGYRTYASYGYRGYYGYPRYYGSRYYGYPGYYGGGGGFYFGTPRAGFYFY